MPPVTGVLFWGISALSLEAHSMFQNDKVYPFFFNITLLFPKCFPWRIINFLLETETWWEASPSAEKGTILW